jgi:hypothetical protein
MKLLSKEILHHISGGDNAQDVLLVDFREAYGITDPAIITPCVMVPIDPITRKPLGLMDI